MAAPMKRRKPQTGRALYGEARAGDDLAQSLRTFVMLTLQIILELDVQEKPSNAQTCPAKKDQLRTIINSDICLSSCKIEKKRQKNLIRKPSI